MDSASGRARRAPRRDRIAVVGGGIFGITAAVELAREGHQVDLFERQPELLSGASGGNNLRLHHGYHYPRSPATVHEVQRSVAEFKNRYRSAVLADSPHYVAIAATGSRISADQYLSFCDEFGLARTEEQPAFLRKDAVSLCVRIEEDTLDLQMFRKVCHSELDEAGVEVFLSVSPDMRSLSEYRAVVLATYWSLNACALDLGLPAQEMQFDVVELPVVEAPEELRNVSVVVMDGPFMCIDPFGDTGMSLLGHVTHGMHGETRGFAPLIPAPLFGAIERGVVPDPAVTDVAEFLRTGATFFHGFERVRHAGSIFSVRAILPELQATDARQSTVRRLSDNVYAVLGGKIPSAIGAARDLVRLMSDC